ncbi:MAG: YceI family protein [Verrucomicrobiae bacterium]|jgi:polyisoprenoid-binding protein YceI|nr:YceI family protein [Verrucomicrobiae bacterium]
MTTSKFILRLGAIACAAALQLQAADKASYISQPGSTMRIVGTSTIHDWHAESKLIGGRFECPADFPAKAEAGPVALTADTMIMANSFSCSSGSAMDKVMRGAIKADEHRFIRYTLKEATVKETGTDGVVVSTKGDLSVAGISKPVTMDVTVKPGEANKLTFSASTQLKMTDFGIQPPSPAVALGLIKTADEVTINFEWKTVRK